MTPGRFAFDRFVLDQADRRLTRDGARIELNARYLDALALMVSEHGKLVSKDRFLDEVWKGVPVTDEALTQCIKTLRRQLGDDAASPRFIETVPKHGYRFVAEVREKGDPRVANPARYDWRRLVVIGGAGTLGGAVAGLVGGLFYGFAGASQPGIGAVSVLLVLVCLTVGIALVGAAGVSFGVAAAGLARTPRWCTLGGALGGLIVGAVVKLIGIDTFNLLLGQAPRDITGASEGLMLGAAVGLGAALSWQWRSLRNGVAFAALAGAVAGVLIALLGGRLMAGSLASLAERFPDSRLRLDRIGAWFGEDGLGPVGQIVTGALEGALFAAFIVGAMALTRRSWSDKTPGGL